jgi:uncharacterized protein
MSDKQEFFKQDEFVLLGDSRTRSFPAYTEKYLRREGKTFWAVDLGGGGKGRLASLEEVPATPRTAIVEVHPDRTTEVVADLLGRGYRRLWIHQGIDNEEVVRLAREAGAEVETGSCAVLYLAPTMSAHALHRAVWKILGRY